MLEYYVQTASFSRELRADFHGCMGKIRQAGYAGVELFDGIYGGYIPSELQTYMDELGLEILGAHVASENMPEQLEYLSGTKCKYIVCPGVHVSSAREAEEMARAFTRFGQASRELGMKFGYHSHDNDFDTYGGKAVIEIFMEETDPELVTFELDAAWAWRSGIDAAEFIDAHKGRFDLIHLKETTRRLYPEDSFAYLMEKFGLKRGEDGRPIITEEARPAFEERRKINCAMGDGLINPPTLIPCALAQGTKAFIVEREYAYTGDIFTSLAEDVAYLKGLNL